MKLIVGLGNPGKEYENTRHNIGFMSVDKIIHEKNLTEKEKFNGKYYEYAVETDGALNECNVIFSDGSGNQTGDNVKIRNYGIYNQNGDTGITSGVAKVGVDDANAPVEYYNLQGIRISRPISSGTYIVRKGNKASKVIIR